MEEKGDFTGEERLLLELLAEALKETLGAAGFDLNRKADWNKVLRIAWQHRVLPLLHPVLEKAENHMKNGVLSEQEETRLQESAQSTVQQSYRLLFLSRYLLELLEAEGIPAVLLKGSGTSYYYPVPELRKSGDVDLLLTEPELLERACGLLEAEGFRRKENQPVQHHLVCRSPEGIDIELHTMLTEPFDNRKVNRYLRQLLEECFRQSELREVMGVKLRVLKSGFHGYELLLHMLQHFLRSGFGLKLLCDWVVFWNHGMEEKEQKKFLKLLQDTGLGGFADMVTAVSIRYLGLESNKVSWFTPPPAHSVEEFMKEILEAEEFGKSQAERMVTLRGSGLTDYIREFHHQMQLNFPKASKSAVLWPVLWVVTLARFLRNNKKLRRVSSLEVLRKAGERSRVMRHMRLFQAEKGNNGSRYHNMVK